MKNPPVQEDKNALLYQPGEPGLLQLRGRDQMAFIQRQTTNNIDHLGPDHGLISVLTTPLARIIDVFFLFKEVNADELVLNLITLPGRGQTTARYLKSRVFFNDQVSLQDASATTRQFWLDGPQAFAVLQKAGTGNPPPVDGVQKTILDGQEVTLIGRRGLTGIGYLILIPEQVGSELESSLVQKGAVRLTQADYNTMRIESGLPGDHTELIEAHTPFEVGLDYAVSANKGCYTGQEVLARQVNYDKITRQMVGLRLETAAQPGQLVLVGGKPAGEITSAVVSPKFGPIALAVIKRPFFEAGNMVQVKSGETIITGTTCPLPFSQ